MDQDSFVRVRTDNWKKLDSMVERIRKHGIRAVPPGELRELGILYKKACLDLSCAISRGYDRKLVEYLNGCVGRAYTEIYRDEPFTPAQIGAYLLRGFPRKVRANSPFILAAFLIFTVCAMVVYVQVFLQPELASYFVSESILNSFEKGIGERSASQFVTTEAKSTISHQIMTNNIIVGVNAFATGIFYGIGTLYLLVTNAALLGALAALCARNNEAIVFWSLILPHGVIELTSIYICGGAGFLLAYALIHPGNSYRIDALKRNGREAAQLMLGAIMLFVIAAVIEGFLTPLPVSPWLKLAFSALTAITLLYYLLKR